MRLRRLLFVRALFASKFAVNYVSEISVNGICSFIVFLMGFLSDILPISLRFSRIVI